MLRLEPSSSSCTARTYVHARDDWSLARDAPLSGRPGAPRTAAADDGDRSRDPRGRAALSVEVCIPRDRQRRPSAARSAASDVRIAEAGAAALDGSSTRTDRKKGSAAVTDVRIGVMIDDGPRG